MSGLSGPSWGPSSKEAPKQLVIICHGVAADGHTVIRSAPSLGLSLPNAVFVAPNGPEVCGTGRQWFPFPNMNPVVLAVGVRPAAKHLNEFIDEQLLKYDLPPTAYALMGFSQGAVTVLFAGLRRTHAPRVILSFSGGLLAPETLKSEMKNHAPVLLWHGEIDRVIPAVHSKNAAAQLRAANVPVEMVFAPKLGHGVNPAMLQPAASSLQRAFKEKSLT